jgi:hypothetical protein
MPSSGCPLPTTYAQLQSTQRRMGLRTVAEAWEFLLRLGLAAAERLPIAVRKARMQQVAHKRLTISFELWYSDGARDR